MSEYSEKTPLQKANYANASKDLLVTNLINKGFPITANNSFREVALEVGNNSTVVDTSNANATSSDIFSGKSAYVNGQLVTGSANDYSSGGTIDGDLTLINEHYLKGKDSGNNIVNLARAYSNSAELGDSTKNLKLYCNSQPKVIFNNNTYTLATLTENVSTASTDLNNYTSEGTFYFSSSYTPTNVPTNETQGWLQVIVGLKPSGNNYRTPIKQIWYSRNSNKVFSRYNKSEIILGSSSWEAWTQEPTSSEVNQLQLDLLDTRLSLLAAQSDITSLLSKSTITAALNSNSSVTITNRYDPDKVTLTKLELYNGLTFNLDVDNTSSSYGGIIVNRDCKALISASSTMKGPASTMKILVVYIISNNTTRVFQTAYHYTADTNYANIALTPKGVDLYEGDIIYLGVSSNSTGAQIDLASSNYTYLTVQEL